MTIHSTLPSTPRLKKVVQIAVQEAKDLGCNYIGTEHLLLAILREKENPGARIIEQMGWTNELVTQLIEVADKRPRQEAVAFKQLRVKINQLLDGYEL